MPQPVLFSPAAVAVFPPAALRGHAPEEPAVCTGDTVGGLLNATFGNAPELIIALRGSFTRPSPWPHRRHFT